MPNSVDDLLNITKRKLKAYGQDVVEQRAVPDYRDGLKPVHRMILWSCYNLGLKYGTPFRKAARTVGDVLGKYHPHGDQCLRGTTLVPMLNGTNVALKSLVDSDAGSRWVLAFDKKTNAFVPALAHSWRVGKRTKKLYRLHLSNGDVVEGTGNHPFFSLTRQSWVRLDELRNDEELLGGTISSDAYPVLRSNISYSRAIHHLVGDYKYDGLEEGEVYHHIDENTLNNKPSNIAVLLREDHAAEHGDYLSGLAGGRKTMFSGKTKYRKAIKAKNSALLTLHNENLWMLKVVKAVNLLREDGKPITASNYESLRNRIYNLTKIQTLEERGITFDNICDVVDRFKIDTSKATGKTLHLKKARVRSTPKTRGHENPGALFVAISNAISKCGLRANWSRYKKFCSQSNLNKTVYSDVAHLKHRFSVESVEQLAEEVPAHFLLLVKRVEIVDLPDVEDFYDFTVEKYENMVILSSAGNFVVTHNSTYQAMVGIAGTMSDDGKTWSTRNSCIPLLEGYGNWGDNIDNAAAYRYTECRLSEFSTKYLLDPVYLAVSDYVPNFSGDDRVPLVLPARLPVLLLNGSVSIAFGVSAECPSFKPKGVIELVRRCLSGEEITPKLCTQILEFAPVYGGVCVSETKEIFAFHKTGSGSMTFLPEMVFDEKKRTVTIASSCPGLTSKASWATLTEKLSQMKSVRSVSDSSDRHGFRFEIVSERTAEFDTFAEMIEKAVLRRQSYSIGITKRETDNVSFSRINVANTVKEWCAWRIQLESKVIKYLISLEEAKLLRLQLLLLAVNNLKVIVASLSKEDSAAYISQHLKITIEEANLILDMKVRQLKALERTKLIASVKAVESELQTLKASLKKPVVRVLKDLDTITL